MAFEHERAQRRAVVKTARSHILSDLRTRGARQHLRAFEVVGDLDQRIDRNDLQIRARPGCFRAAGGPVHQPVRIVTC